MPPILTDADGRPFEKPQLKTGATIEEVIAYIRASNAYRDAVAAAANQAFERALARELKP